MKEMAIAVIVTMFVLIANADEKFDADHRAEMMWGHDAWPEPTPIDKAPEIWRQRIEEVRKNAAKRPPIEVGLDKATVCNVVLETTIIFWGSPHLYAVNPLTGTGDKLRLLGPISNDDSYLLIPVPTPPAGGLGIPSGYWTHPWVDDVYKAVPDPGFPSSDRKYLISHVGVHPHGSSFGPYHYYRMQITGMDPDDGCPSQVEFWNLGHEGRPAANDPGHAGTSRD